MRGLVRVVFGLLVLVLFVEIMIIAPEKLSIEEDARKARRQSKETADQHMKKVHLVESRGGRREWELFAENAAGFQGQGEWDLSKVKVVFFSENGATFTAVGEKGKIDTGSKDIEIRGRVKTVSSNGYEFATEKILYTDKEKILASPKSVVMKGPKAKDGTRMEVQANQMKTLLGEGRMDLDGEVKAFRNVNGGKDINITSQQAQFSGKSNLARFAGGVSLKFEKMIMTGPEAMFEYRPGSDLPASVFLNGGIRVEDSDKVAQADNLKVDFDANKYVLKGRPRVLQNGDELFGDEIVFLDGGKRVKVEKVKARVKEDEVKQ